MPDIIDEANERADLFREAALTAKLAGGKPEERPLYLDGVRCCLDCEEPIPEARLDANPDAVRCTSCQTAKDNRDRAERRRA